MSKPNEAMSKPPSPIALIILDGWGYSENPESNAIMSASTPVWDRLWKEFPHTLIKTSGADVGLPADQMGNSEVGHLNLGAGRVVYQEFTRVSRSIRTGSFFKNRTLTEAVDAANANNKAVHILGLLSPGGVHSHEDHIHAMIKLAVERGCKNVYVHAFLDGRDTAPKSATESLALIQERFTEYGGGQIASVIGRYYSMDRDHRWPRIQAAYDLITQGKAEFEANTPQQALDMAYARDETDEFVLPTRILDAQGKTITVNDGDSIIFMNYRSDRARQITRPFIEDDFDGFEREAIPKLASFTSLTEYKADFDAPVAFPAERLRNTLGEYLAKLGMHQLRIAETEKYAHVTFFFNGGVEDPYDGEDRILVPSPLVATYDQQPEMNAEEVTDKLIAAIESGKYDTIICNYANPDMVGHSGKFDAAVKAIEALDYYLGRLARAMHAAGGEMLITADHGNAELMLSPTTGQPQTSHTTNPVPMIYVGREAKLKDGGSLADIAPTLLTLMDLPQPDDMTGQSLVELANDA